MSDENRLIEIEIKIAHQEKIISDLSDVMYAQQRQIDTLEKALADVKTRLQASKTEPEIGPADEKPPHY